MVHKCTIHTATSDVLSEFLALHNIRMTKSATKATKIRRLMSLDEVTGQCEASEIQAVEQVLQDLEEKRKRKKQEPAEEEREEDEQATRVAYRTTWVHVYLTCRPISWRSWRATRQQLQLKP